ncbi:MAG: 4a-hydroxytetrahydrobiopterin dehydratase [Alphaproteobacteria bacterium]|nr:4a-hydroxytetrahydrobiopterin dehydratase [Alphaproteobacteria bacterium]
MTLSDRVCRPCRRGTPPLAAAEARRLLDELPQWTLAADAKSIERTFAFKGFTPALVLVQRIGALAEEQGHHPDIAFGWGYARIVFTTHDIGGLHDNDFIMAAKVDRLAG